MPYETQPASDRPTGRYFAETGHHVGQPFLGFLEHHGLTVCGFPITDIVLEDGVRTQYFENLALEEHSAGRLRVKALGASWLAMRRREARRAPVTGVPDLEVVNLAEMLPRHPTAVYPTRPLADIRYLVLHHTGASRDVGARLIADEHVAANGWPGIGYHFVVDADGTVSRTQDLTTVSYHARQFNPVSVGIALTGDLSAGLPSSVQLERTADLVARLRADLGLPEDSVRGHREMVPTPCPGETFLAVWKPRLMRAVAERLGAETPPAPAARPPVSTVVPPGAETPPAPAAPPPESEAVPPGAETPPAPAAPPPESEAVPPARE